MDDLPFYVLIIGGVSGTGKTTIGQRLASDIGWDFYDGDDFHPQANIDKMSSGIPLTDEDRLPWLDKLKSLMQDAIINHKPMILACSALKEDYRKRLLFNDELVQMVFLLAKFDAINQRMQQREDHYFKAEMLQSQFDALEIPEDLLVIDASRPLESILIDLKNEFFLD